MSSSQASPCCALRTRLPVGGIWGTYLCCHDRLAVAVPPFLLRQMEMICGSAGDNGHHPLLRHHVLQACWTPLCGSIAAPSQAAVLVVDIRCLGIFAGCCDGEPVLHEQLHDSNTNMTTNVILQHSALLAQRAALAMRRPPAPLMSCKIDLLVGTAFATVLRVVRLPVLEAFAGPSALVLCPGSAWCDELAYFMRLVADEFHLVVHNGMSGPPLMPPERRADILVTTPAALVGWWCAGGGAAWSAARAQLGSRCSILEQVRRGTVAVTPFPPPVPLFVSPASLYASLSAVWDVTVVGVETIMRIGVESSVVSPSSLQVAMLDGIFSALAVMRRGGRDGGTHRALRASFISYEEVSHESASLRRQLLSLLCDSAGGRKNANAPPLPMTLLTFEVPPAESQRDNDEEIRGNDESSLQASRKRLRSFEADEEIHEKPCVQSALTWAMLLLNMVSLTTMATDGPELLDEILAEVTHRVVAASSERLLVRAEFALLQGADSSLCSMRWQPCVVCRISAYPLSSPDISPGVPAIAASVAAALHGVIFDGRHVVAMAVREDHLKSLEGASSLRTELSALCQQVELHLYQLVLPKGASDGADFSAETAAGGLSINPASPPPGRLPLRFRVSGERWSSLPLQRPAVVRIEDPSIASASEWLSPAPAGGSILEQLLALCSSFGPVASYVVAPVETVAMPKSHSMNEQTEEEEEDIDVDDMFRLACEEVDQTDVEPSVGVSPAPHAGCAVLVEFFSPSSAIECCVVLGLNELLPPWAPGRAAQPWRPLQCVPTDQAAYNRRWQS
jgi:hypothetical protein